MNIPAVGSNCQIIVEEVDGVKDVRVNVEAESDMTGFMVEKALKEALGFSLRGMTTTSEGCLGRMDSREGVL
jgi:phenylacetate-CoA ligase